MKMMASKTSYKLLSDSDDGGEGNEADCQECKLVGNTAEVDEQDAKTAFLEAAGSGGLLIGMLVSFVAVALPVLRISKTSCLT
jgi:hypothetical protein